MKKDIDFSEELHESIMRAFDVEATSKTIEALTGMTLEQIAEEARNGGIVPKQELPVIPNYIADFLNERKDWALFEIFDDVYLRNEHPRVNEWLYGDGIEVPQGREIKMVMALKFGYKLEPEQKYYIRDQHGVYLLAKNHREQGKVQTVAEIVEQYGIEEIELDYELTEQEIKDYDERYWPFAVKVEELEE